MQFSHFLPVLPILLNVALAANTFNPLEHLAGISPPFQPRDPPLDPRSPQGCNVTRAAYLVRHAAIYTNDYDWERYIGPFISKLLDSTIDWTKSPSLRFLATWRPPMGASDQEKLTQSGQTEAERLGVELLRRYPGFRPPKKVWATASERTLRSAQSLVWGLAEYENETSVIPVSESRKAGADTLTPYRSCPAYRGLRGAKEEESIYTRPIVARFKAEAPAFDFTADDIVAMQELCGYETAIHGSSPFCSPRVFSPNEWLGFEYMWDLWYFHHEGYGSEISGVIGLPWVLASTDLLLSDCADQDIFVSFSHRHLPMLVMVTLGLFNNTAFSGGNDIKATMPTEVVNHRRAWKSSQILPFLSTVAIERLECDSYGFEDEAGLGEYYRVVVNQSPQTLPGCADGPGESCSRTGFLKFLAQRQAMFGGFSERCGVNYAHSTDVLDMYRAP